MTKSKTPPPNWERSANTVAQIFKAAVERFPNTIYCKTVTGSLTYSEAGGAIQALADKILPQVSGRAVALILPNSKEFLIAYFAVLFAGGKPALLNHGHPPATMEKLMADLDPALIISDCEVQNRETIVLNDRMTQTLAKPIAATDLHPVGTSTDIAAILYSGGTTGLPKQVPHSNTALIAKIDRGEWGWPTQLNEVWLPVAPFTHVYGYLMGLTNPLLNGGTVVIPERFQPDLIVGMLREEKITIFGGGPPAIYQAIMASDKFSQGSFPHLRLCPGGGAPFPLDLHKRWKDSTGLTILEGYGMTEIAPISINTIAHGVKPGAAGKAVPDTKIEIVDLENGSELQPTGIAGEIRVKGPHLMTEYVNNPAETARTMRDGYVYTGDIGTLDEDGFLTITDRKKDVIFVKGFNAFPREIEELLLTHSCVSGACVVGKKDDRSGETPEAFLTLRAETNEEEIIAFCSQNLIAYKVPTKVSILDALPLTPAGKVDRLALKKRAAE